MEILPRKIINDAIKAVPATKYALVVGGISSVVAIIAGYDIDYKIAVFGTLLIIIMMFILLVFSKLSKQVNKIFLKPALFITWSFLLLTIITSTLLITSYFFKWPKSLETIMEKQINHESIKEHNNYWQIYEKEILRISNEITQILTSKTHPDNSDNSDEKLVVTVKNLLDIKGHETLLGRLIANDISVLISKLNVNNYISIFDLISLSEVIKLNDINDLAVFKREYNSRLPTINFAIIGKTILIDKYIRISLKIVYLKTNSIISSTTGTLPIEMKRFLIDKYKKENELH